MTRSRKTPKHGYRVVGQPRASAAFHDGVRQMVAAIAPTLGPLPKVVAIAPVAGIRAPELLDDGGTIARRITDLPNRDADMGAMYLRSMLWRLHQKAGDGTATAAVIFDAVYTAGRRYLAAGGSAMRLRHFIDQGLKEIVEHIGALAVPVGPRQQLTQVANTAGADPLLAGMLGEIFDIVGEWGTVEIRSGYVRELERSYVEGMQWEGGILSSHLLTDATAREARIEEATVLASDFRFDGPDDLVPVMELVIRHQREALLITCQSISDRAIAFLVANQKPGTPRVIAVRTPDAGSTMMNGLTDLTVLAGGRPLTIAAGDSPRAVRIEDLGRVRRAWANQDYAGIAAGAGDPRALRRHVVALKTAARGNIDPEMQAAHARRVGRLVGGTAVLWVGAPTASELKHRKAVAERTARVMRGAISDGIVPGGGSALHGCQEALRARMGCSHDTDERAAYSILLEAVAAPMQVLAANAGLELGTRIPRLALLDAQHGIDVRYGTVVNMVEAGIIDSAAVLISATRTAVSSAALALTIDLLVHTEHPEEVLEP